MILESDDEGRLSADSEQLRASIFPYRRTKMPSIPVALQKLASVGLVRLYHAAPSADDAARIPDPLYAELHDWADHQRIHKNHFTPSKLPIPQVILRDVPDLSRTSPGPVPPDRIGSERNGSDRKGGESEGREPDPAGALHGAPSQAPKQNSQANPDTQPEHIGGSLQEFMATIRRGASRPEQTIPPPRPARGFRGADPDPPSRNGHGHHHDEVAI
jgi:hypothetical protein